MKKMKKNSLSIKISSMRKESKMTQMQLSAKTGISRSHIAKIETNRIHNLSAETIYKISSVLPITTDEIIQLIREN